MRTLRNGSRKRFTACCDKVITFYHGSGAMVALRRLRNGDWRSLRLSARRQCRFSRIVARIRGCVVPTGRESSAEHESGGSGNLLDGDCWTTIACVDLACGETQEERLWNLPHLEEER